MSADSGVRSAQEFGIIRPSNRRKVFELVSRGDLPGVRILGRPFKPLAVGTIIMSANLVINTFLLFYANRACIPLPGDGAINAEHSIYAFVMGLFSALGVASMVGAWVIRSQRIYEFGLLLCFGGWTARWVGLTLDGNPWYAMLPLGMSIMVAGAYWLERIDDHDGMR